MAKIKIDANSGIQNPCRSRKASLCSCVCAGVHTTGHGRIHNCTFSLEIITANFKMGTQHYPLSSYYPPLISWLSNSPETISYPLLLQCQLILSSAADDPASNLAENTGLIRWRFPHLLSTKSTNLPLLVPALSDSPPERKGSQLLFGWAKRFICGSHLILLSLLPCTSPLLLKSPPLYSVPSVSSSLMVAIVCKYAALFPK